MKNKIHAIYLISLFSIIEVLGQKCNKLNFQLQSEIPTTCNQMTITMIHDQEDRPFLYVANKEAGLRIYNITALNSPMLAATVPISKFENLEVMSVSQSDQFLYLTLGNTFITPQRGGMAIVDISDPLIPVVTDYYVVPGVPSGGGIIKVEDNFAYFGAMASGLIILNVLNKNDIQFVSQFIPDINFPPIAKPDTLKINARGMEVKNSIVYLCYDAGGFRIIDCSNKSSPKEIGRYANPTLYIPFNLPRAYNNIILDDPYVYVTVDYCGLEVLDISDPKDIKLKGWWNPYNCPNNNWFNSPSHTNELVFDKECKLLYIATGKSDMMVLDVSNPAQPDSCNFYGGVSNDIGTWGINKYKNQIYLSYVCVPLPWPFPSNWTGVRILTHNDCSITGITKIAGSDLLVYPNPAAQEFNIVVPDYFGQVDIRIYDLQGKLVKSVFDINAKEWIITTKEFKQGLYTIKLTDGLKTILQKCIIQ